jgi:hypothetical protein
MPKTVIYKPNGPLPFDPNFRTGNCYTYALGVKALGLARPGQLKMAFSQQLPKSELNIQKISERLKKDGVIKIREHGGNKPIDQIFACFVAPELDYHFYRLHPDGTWSHKIGHDDPDGYDFSHDTIHCPLNAKRGDYTDFVGFYRVPRTGLRYVV